MDARAPPSSGAGEILLNSMDADGTKDGYDLPLIRLVRAAVDVPVIASGGAGKLADFAPAVEAGADAVLAASVFHFGELTVGDVKDGCAPTACRCADRSVPVARATTMSVLEWVVVPADGDLPARMRRGRSGS